MKSNIKSLGILGGVLSALTVRKNLIKPPINKNMSLVNTNIIKNSEPNPQQLYDNCKKQVVTVVSIFELEEEETNPLTYFLPFPYDLIPKLFKKKLEKKKVVAIGSGFKYEYTDGTTYIITNCHVIQTYSKTTGKMYTARPYIIENNSNIQSLTEVTNKGDKPDLKEATIIGYDDFQNGVDIAVLKCESLEDNEVLKLEPKKKEDGTPSVNVGDFAMAIGNPVHFLLGDTITTGIVSGTERYITNNYTKFIQTDASINRGNSGGPLINSEGNVIGVNTILLSSTGESNGLGFAIPSDRVTKTVEELIKLKGDDDGIYQGNYCDGEDEDEKDCIDKDQFDMINGKKKWRPKASRISRYWLGITPTYVVKELLDIEGKKGSNIEDCGNDENSDKCSEKYDSWLKSNKNNSDYNLDCNVLDICKGVFITSVNKNSPAAGKLEKYDIIVGMTNHLNETNLASVNDVQEFIENLEKLYKINKKLRLKLKIVRDNKLVETPIEIKLGVRPQALKIALSNDKNLEFENTSYLEFGNNNNLEI